MITGTTLFICAQQLYANSWLQATLKLLTNWLCVIFIVSTILGNLATAKCIKMYKWLISHRWKESLRSSIWQKNVIINIFLGLFIVYMLLVFVLLGGAMKEIISESFDVEGSWIIEKFNGLLLYYLIFDLVIRFFVQKIPILAARPYLHLPIAKNKLIHFLLQRTILSMMNFFPVLLFLPFFLRMLGEFPNHSALPWFLTIASLVFFNNFLTFYLKKQLTDKGWVVLLIALGIAGIAFLDHFGILPLMKLSELIFNVVLNYPISCLAFMALPLLIYKVNFDSIAKRLFLEEIDKGKKEVDTNTKVNYFKRYGTIGELVVVELKLMLRNKRTRSTVILAPLLILYGFFFYPNPMYQNVYGWLIFAGLFVTGGFMISYGQFLVAWESSYFDTILTKNIDFERYFRAKYYILVIPTIVAFVLSTPYIFFGMHIFYINIAAFLFNVGVNVHIYMFFSAFNQKRINLAGSAMFNYQGVGAKQFLVAVPVMLVPVLVYNLVAFFAGQIWGIVAVGSIGLLGVALTSVILKATKNFFLTRKYQIAEGYRQDY